MKKFKTTKGVWIWAPVRMRGAAPSSYVPAAAASKLKPRRGAAAADGHGATEKVTGLPFFSFFNSSSVLLDSSSAPRAYKSN